MNLGYSITEAEPLVAATFRRGDAGWLVIVCQDALNSHFPSPPLALDGVFGQQTEGVAKDVQAACGVLVDGIVGPVTQAAFVGAKCRHAEAGVVPSGLLVGLCKIESSYQWAAVSPLNSNGSHDYGCTQRSLIKPGVGELLAAFDPQAATHLLAGELVGAHNAFGSQVTNRRAWELAALHHNWPAAAFAIATGRDGWLSEPEGWLDAKGYANGWDYANHYMAVACERVTRWTP